MGKPHCNGLAYRGRGNGKLFTVATRCDVFSVNAMYGSCRNVPSTMEIVGEREHRGSQKIVAHVANQPVVNGATITA